MSRDVWVKCLTNQGNVRGVAIQAVDLVQKMVDTHQLNDAGAKGLGEAVIGGLLVASACRDGERINLNIQGSGHCKQAFVDAYPSGIVRGYVIERSKEDEEAHKIKQFGPWGAGHLSVLRAQEKEAGQPYIGNVPLLTGHLAKDLTYYWVQSEQIPSAAGITVKVEKNKIVSAGGFLIQALPNASDHELKLIESRFKDLENLEAQLTKGDDPQKVLSTVLQDIGYTVLEERGLQFKCSCSMERVEQSIMLLGPVELKDILLKEKKVTVVCEFCTKNYEVGADKLKEMVSRAAAQKLVQGKLKTVPAGPPAAKKVTAKKSKKKSAKKVTKKKAGAKKKKTGAKKK